MSIMMILSSMERITAPILAITKAMVAACEFFTVIDAPLPPSGSLKPNISSDDLAFEEVTFEYPSRPGVRVLDGLTLRLRQGQNTAFVGPSGSGKSTIVALLERWYSLREQVVLPKVVEAKPTKKTGDDTSDSPEEKKQPTKGEISGNIMIGGHNLEDLDLKWWRSQIGLVQQEPFLFNDTIFGNVANGLIGTQWEDETEEKKREMVREACAEAYAHEFVNRLPNVGSILSSSSNGH
jgi:ATP-binding cassette, subfamily B (MDR/TAP), member 1